MADPIVGTASPISQTTIYLSVAGLLVAYILFSRLYDAFLGPLSKFPGPKLYAVSQLPCINDKIRGKWGIVSTALHDKYGPIVRTGPNTLSFLGDTQTWNDIYGHKKAGHPKPFKNPNVYEEDQNGTRSILSADDVNHARMRKILSHAFSDRTLREQEPMFKHWVGKLLSKLSDLASGHQQVDMLKFYNCTTFDVMGDLTFGENLNMLDNGELSTWVKTIFESIKVAVIAGHIMEIHPAIKWFFKNAIMNTKAMSQKAKEHWSYSSDRLNRRLERGETDRPDLWSKILAKSDSTEGMSSEEHHTTAALFMVAGTETTATALSGTTYYLLQNPKKLKELTDEIRTAFSEFEDITLDALNQLKYLQACLQEGLRMYPPVPVEMARSTPQPGCTIMGRWVPGDTTVGIPQFASHHSASRFAHPYEFHPERWLEENSTFKDDTRDAMEPFSFGPRNCIGKNLAWHEMRLILASVLLKYDLKLCKESDSWDNQSVYTLWEKIPLMCTLTPADKA